jgi:3-phenylpropionate/trans-cinnamate dioxygenase ferredoxin reductase component
MYGIVTDDIFAAGDVARSPHPLFGFEFLALEHWSNAVVQAEIAAHNMLHTESERRPTYRDRRRSPPRLPRR